MNFFNVFRELKVQPLQLSTVHWCVGVRGSEFRVHSSIQNTVSLLGENLWSRWDLDDVVFLLMSRYITVEESYNFTLYTDFIYIACDIVYYNFALYTWGEKWATMITWTIVNYYMDQLKMGKDHVQIILNSNWITTEILMMTLKE